MLLCSNTSQPVHICNLPLQPGLRIRLQNLTILRAILVSNQDLEHILSLQKTLINPQRHANDAFSNVWDILLLKAVTAVDAHLSPYGDSQTRFEEALSIFLPLLPTGVLEIVVAPTWKNLNNRFKKVLADHRYAMRLNSNASGIIEVAVEREDLLDDIMLAIDEWEEAKRTERDERTELDLCLLQAGEEIRARAFNRVSNSENQEEANENSQEIPTSGRRGRKRPPPTDSNDDEDDKLSSHLAAKNEEAEKRLKLEERRFEYEIMREEREFQGLKTAQENDSRCSCVEEKR